MCLIVCIRPLNKMTNGEIKKEYLTNGWDSNKDGCGFSYVKNIDNDKDNRVIIRKGFFIFDKFYESFNKYRSENPESYFMVHFRNASVGDVKADNCHPFKINNNLSMCHNGTIHKLKKVNSKESDSFLLCNLFKTIKMNNFHNNTIYTKLIHGFMGSQNKISFLDSTNTILMYNYDKWTKEENGDIYFSNDYYKNKRVTEIKNDNVIPIDNSVSTNVSNVTEKFIPHFHRGICSSCHEFKYVKYNFELGENICATCLNEIDYASNSIPFDPSINENHNQYKIPTCNQCKRTLVLKSEKDSSLCTACIKDYYGELSVYDHD